MAQQLIKALERGGHKVTLVSELRSFCKDPTDHAAHRAITNTASRERQRIKAEWHQSGTPDLWFCYHPYYKAPDLLGPRLCQNSTCAYVTAEASYSTRRNIGFWAKTQADLLMSIKQAAVNIHFTQRDFAGMKAAAPAASFAHIHPFIQQKSTPAAALTGARLACVAMMRGGDKLNSYTHLSAALHLVQQKNWHLDVIGDGPFFDQVRTIFAPHPKARITWHGQLKSGQISGIFAQCAAYVWPGCGEAYGLAYLEAQVAGLPVIAFDTAGVPAVIHHDKTGILVKDADNHAFAAAIDQILSNDSLRKTMGATAQEMIATNHTLNRACARLNDILQQIVTHS